MARRVWLSYGRLNARRSRFSDRALQRPADAVPSGLAAAALPGAMEAVELPADPALSAPAAWAPSACREVLSALGPRAVRLLRNTRPSINIRRFARCIAQRQRIALENALDDAAAEHGKRALCYGFANGRRNDRVHGFLRLLVRGR